MTVSNLGARHKRTIRIFGAPSFQPAMHLSKVGIILKVPY